MTAPMADQPQTRLLAINPNISSSVTSVIEVCFAIHASHTAMVRASSTNSVAILGFIDQPTALREYKSITTARYSHPS